MRSFSQYINEAKESSTNFERRKELEDWLAGHNYPDYVKILNKMMDDPKTATLIKDGFGGKLGTSRFKFKVKHIKPKVLRPTQSDIDIEKSLKHALTRTENIKNDFKKEVVIAKMPLVTFRGNYIIDGHHRWIEAAIINPDASMLCFDYDSDDISPIEMLKAVQGNIAASLISHDRCDEDLPISKTTGQNFYDKSWTENQLRLYINHTISDSVVDTLINLKDDLYTKEDVVSCLVDNCISVKNNQYPEDNSPSRGEMPQTDKGGLEKGNKRSSFPDKKGSALNRMSTGKFDIDAVK